MFRFPRTRFVDRNSLSQQLEHLMGEVGESQQALNGNEGFLRVAEELFDVVHSAETALRIIQEKSGLSMMKIYECVEFKNRQRGYYE